jgi:simple sugar transport system substrate-binding protein
LLEAKEASIPVIIVDRMIDVADESLYSCWVGSDFRNEGDQAVSWMQENFSAGPLKIVHIQGTLASSAQIGRTAGLEDGVAGNAGWQIVAQGSGDFAEASGRELMERLLRQDLDFNVIYCENDNMAFGVMEALDGARVAYGEGSNITLISFDATHQGLEETLAGRISFNVECNPLHGPRVAELIQQLEQGQTPAKRSFVAEEVFAAATITQAQIDERDY